MANLGSTRRLRTLFLFVLGAALLAAVLFSAQDGRPGTPPGREPSPARDVSRGLPDSVGRLAFHSTDDRLNRAFDWAKRQALAYARTGDPVGEWYEAALPGRAAFCMRDVSHQASGANALGLASFNKNMLRRFARNISEAKDWCTYWEINSSDKPAPVDYRNDKAFWYNLPANFDVLDAIWRQYEWTGDRSYVDDPVFQEFAARTVTDYVARWDLSLDKVMARRASMNLDRPLDPKDPYLASRGLPSYDEGEPADLNVGADLLAAQYAGYRAHAGLERARGKAAEAAKWDDLAGRLKAFFHKAWWDGPAQSYRDLHFEDGRFKTDSSMLEFLLYFGLTAPGGPTERTVDELLAIRETNIEARSYFPEIFFRYGRAEAAVANILALSDERTPRREYPEVSYAVIGALVRGLMGLEPEAASRTVATWSRLTPSIIRAGIEGVPVLGTWVSVAHAGRTESTFRNEGPAPVTWKACFDGPGRSVRVDGREMPAKAFLTNEGRPGVFVMIAVPPGTSVTAGIR